MLKGIAVDTHAKRISNLVGLSVEKRSLKNRTRFIKNLFKNDIKDINHLFVWHGRNTCIARHPKCDICPIKDFCKYYKNKDIQLTKSL